MPATILVFTPVALPLPDEFEFHGHVPISVHDVPLAQALRYIAHVNAHPAFAHPYYADAKLALLPSRPR